MNSYILIADKFNQRDSNYIIINKWIPENERNTLFEHTNKLRSRKLRMQSVKESTPERAGNQSFLVRKQSPGRKRQRERNTDDLPGVESRMLDNDKLEAEVDHY